MEEQFIGISVAELEYCLSNLGQLVFEVTDACNLRCKYCVYADLYKGYDKRENQYLSFQKAKNIIDYLYALWEKDLSTDVMLPVTIGFYGGEPLLNIPFVKQVIDYIESLKPIGKKIDYSMTTNAVLLDRYMDFLVEKEFRLLISLDGDEAGQSYRVDSLGRNSFGRVFSNIQLLRSKHLSYFEHFVQFNSVLHNRNGVESIYRFIKNTFGKEPSFSQLSNYRVREDQVEQFNETYQSIAGSINQSTDCDALSADLFIKNPETNRLLDYIYNYSGFVFSNYNELFALEGCAKKHPTGTCVPFLKKMFVTVNGKILQCERIDHKFALGEVSDSGVEMDFEKIARRYNQSVFKYIHQCNVCALSQTCTQCVYQKDNIDESRSECDGFCSISQFEERVKRNLEYLDKHPKLYNRILKEVVIRG